MANETIFTRVLALSPAELKSLLKSGIRLLYADGASEIEEWNLIQLIPALIDVVKGDTPAGSRTEWEEKLQAASEAIASEKGAFLAGEPSITGTITSRGKQETALLFLLLIA